MDNSTPIQHELSIVPQCWPSAHIDSATKRPVNRGVRTISLSIASDGLGALILRLLSRYSHCNGVPRLESGGEHGVSPLIFPNLSKITSA
jgi:hypothetical protein